MTLVQLALGYAAVGGLVAGYATIAARATALDAVLLVGLWPLYGPVFAAGLHRAAPLGDADDETRVALGRLHARRARLVAELARVDELIARLDPTPGIPRDRDPL